MVVMQKNIIIVGIIIIIIGIFWPLTTYLRLGNLPGDIIIKKNNFTFYFPIMTSLIISLVCILISYFLKKYQLFGNNLIKLVNYA